MTERYDYRRGELTEEMLADSPFEQLRRWLEDAHLAQVLEPQAMCVSTADAQGRPSARFVLLRGLDERGLTFFTNYDSRKGHELEANPHAAATFWWAKLERQVRIEGAVQRTSPDESDEYFHSRPRDSQIASSASPQSRVIADRSEVEVRVEQLSTEYPEGEVPRPEHWGGYRVVPQRFEFWQGRSARLHDRLVYERSGDGWTVSRLAP